MSPTLPCRNWKCTWSTLPGPCLPQQPDLSGPQDSMNQTPRSSASPSAWSESACQKPYGWGSLWELNHCCIRGSGAVRWRMVKKLHRILAEAAVEILRSIFEEGMVADRAVARALGANPKWGKRDRALVAETVYEIVRWRRKLAILAGAEDAWALAGFWWEQKGFDRPDWAPWPMFSMETINLRQQTLERMPRAVRFSLRADTRSELFRWHRI